MSEKALNSECSVCVKNTFIRLLSVILSLIMLFLSVPLLVSGEKANGTYTPPQDGSVYRFKNAATGLYLSVYLTTTKKTPCKTYIKQSKTTDTTQYFRLSLNDDNTWSIIPKSESEAYALSCTAACKAGDQIELKSVTTITSQMKFDISHIGGNQYTIAPANGENVYAVLEATDVLANDKNKLVKIGNYVYGNESQKWILEPVVTEKITAAFSHTTIKTYSTGKMYARKYPYDSDNEGIIWSSDNENVLLISEDGDYCALSSGVAHLTASADGCSLTLTVEVSDSDCFTWYSQNSITVSDWDGSLLANVKFSAEGRTKKFAADYESNVTNWMTSGCALCSLAMVLHNLDARLTVGYDLRSGQNGNLPADPYTVALANAGSKGATSETATISGSPIYMRWNAVVNRFKVDDKSVVYKKYYSPTKKKIAELLKAHPAGIILVYQRDSDVTHYLVVSGLVNPNEKVSSKIQFIVYDPSGYVASKGDGVPFSETYTATKFGYIYAAYAFDTADNF